MMKLFSTLAMMASAAISLQGFDDWQAKMTGHLLAGHELPVDYRQDLTAMGPGDRFMAIVFLRRSGLLTGPAWALDDLMAPSRKGDYEH